MSCRRIWFHYRSGLMSGRCFLIRKNVILFVLVIDKWSLAMVILFVMCLSRNVTVSSIWVSLLIAGWTGRSMWTLFLIRLIKSGGFLQRNLRACSRDVKLRSYKMYVDPILDYASAIWSPYLVKHINKLESIQRFGARFITGKYDKTCSVFLLFFGTCSFLNWKLRTPI